MRSPAKILLPLGLIFLLILSGCSQGKDETVQNSSGETTSPASLSEPEVLVTPEAVYAIASDYVAAFYESTTETPGYFPRTDGLYQVATQAELLFADWRVDAVTAVYQDEGDLVGYPIGVYRLDFSFRTATPDGVLEAEPAAVIDSDGWFSLALVDFPLYLICSEQEGTYLTLATLTTDVAPGSAGFVAIIADAVADVYAEGLTPRAKLAALLASDGPVYFWQIAAGNNATVEASVDSVISLRAAEYLPIVFDCPWAEAADFAATQTASLFLGTDSTHGFQFYLDSDLVLWHEAGQITAWHAGDVGEALSSHVLYLLTLD